MSLSATPAQLLAQAWPGDVLNEPFAHLIIPDALGSEAYERLAAEFPPLDVIADAPGGLESNQAVRMSCRTALAHPDVSRAWRDFFAYHTSLAYWRDVVRVFGVHLRSALPGLEQRSGRPLEEWRVRVRGDDGAAEVRLDCQFVMNTPVIEPSSVKTAHVDKHDKIFSALFYMRDASDHASGGDLELYRWCRVPRFVKHRALPRDVEGVKTVAYAANTYLGFVNSPRAVHAVTVREVTNVSRRYVNFIAEVPFEAFAPRQIGGLRRWWHGVRADEENS